MAAAPNSAGLDVLIARLNGVRRCGRGFVAKCPAHEDKHPSLSIGEGPDGRVLLHCFGGCAAPDVVAALGLRWQDLFPRTLPDRQLTPQERAAQREGIRQAQWRAALGVLAKEATVVLIAARAIHVGPLSQEDDERLREAQRRIEASRMVLSGT